MIDFYSRNDLSAIEAISLAQKIAAGPMLFQTVCFLLKHGVLEALDKAGAGGLSKSQIAKECQIPEYGISVLLDMALSGQIVYTPSEDKIALSSVGYFILHDRMTRINFEVTQNVFYQALYYLEDSVMEERPVGLGVFNKEWTTIYPHLSELPPAAKKSWFEWDHFYSDAAFKPALKEVLKLKPALIYDVGGNTGKFSIACCNTDPDVRVTILDLKEQIKLAKDNIAAHQLEDRVSFTPVDVLGSAQLPGEADVWWMSQFLDCFSAEQVKTILSNIRAVMKENARVCILELFWDNQRFEAASYSLNAQSLYFTAIANGNSRFYAEKDFKDYLKDSGFEVERSVTGLGVSHTLLICRPV